MPTASPRNAIYGHAIGIACGYAALLLTGLEHAPPAMAIGVDLNRVLAAALSLAATGASAGTSAGVGVGGVASGCTGIGVGSFAVCSVAF